MCCGKDENKQKEAEIGPFLKKKILLLGFISFSTNRTILSRSSTFSTFSASQGLTRAMHEFNTTFQSVLLHAWNDLNNFWPGANFISQFKSSITTLHKNIAMWLAVPSPMTSFNQLESFISTQYSYATVKLVYDIGSWVEGTATMSLPLTAASIQLRPQNVQHIQCDRLGYFWKVLATNFLTKEAQISNDFSSSFEKC